MKYTNESYEMKWLIETWSGGRPWLTAVVVFGVNIRLTWVWISNVNYDGKNWTKIGNKTKTCLYSLFVAFCFNR